MKLESIIYLYKSYYYYFFTVVSNLMLKIKSLMYYLLFTYKVLCAIILEV